MEMFDELYIGIKPSIVVVVGFFSADTWQHRNENIRTVNQYQTLTV